MGSQLQSSTDTMNCFHTALVLLVASLVSAQRYDIDSNGNSVLYPGTEPHGSPLWNEMEAIAKAVGETIDNEDVDGFMEYITEHSWTMAPGQVGVVGIKDNREFYTKEWATEITYNDIIMEECGGTDQYAWSRGRMNYNGLLAVYGITLEKLEEGADWTINLLAWTFHKNNSESALNQFFTETAIKVAMAAGENVTDASNVTKQYRGTVENGTQLWNDMHRVAMDLTIGINNKDFPLTIDLYHDHSWVFPPAHIGVLGIVETDEFIRVLFMAGTIILETTLFEVGGNNRFAWARGSTRVNHFKSLFLITCERTSDDGVWKTNLLAWAISADNPKPSFKAVLEAEKKKAEAEAELKAAAVEANQNAAGFSFTRV